MTLRVATFAAAALCSAMAHAQSVVTYVYEGNFDDATFAVESAIIDRGLVIDSVSHVGEMLNRTGADVGSDTRIFEAADVFNFCSAVISREAMEADPMNIVHCPYGIFVVDTGDGVLIGHQGYEGSMAKVGAFLAEIAEAAASE